MNKLKLLFVFGILIMVSCTTVFKTSPYKSYQQSLETTGLAETTLGKSWIEIGQKVIQSPNDQLKYPFKEEIFFREENPLAIAYKIAYTKSSKLKFTIKSTGKEQKGIFMDLFEVGETLKNLQSKRLRDTSFMYEDENDQTLILRLQPHLLVNEYVEVEIVEQPKLAFPVQNGKNKDIKSFWGVDREGGARKHEGVDIFGKRGTSIVAVADGIINRVQITNLGGKVVWQRLGFSGPSIYYAHLDSQIVSEGQTVKKGEVLGLMGNTGNAISTSPHLHFGIYAAGSAVDPINYILYKDTIHGKIKSEGKYLGKQVLLTDKKDILPVDILAVSTNNVTYQDYSGAISRAENLSVNTKKIKFYADPNSSYLLNAPKNVGVPIAKFNIQESYAVLGSVNDFIYVEQRKNKGWVSVKP